MMKSGYTTCFVKFLGSYVILFKDFVESDSARKEITSHFSVYALEIMKLKQQTMNVLLAMQVSSQNHIYFVSHHKRSKAEEKDDQLSKKMKIAVQLSSTLSF